MVRRIEYMGATPRPGLENYPLQIWDWLTGTRRRPSSSDVHLQATMRWLAHAQDVGDDDGVARMYHIRNGWGSSYPETTGYIVPTFFAYADFSGDTEFRDRAVRMTEWESDVQMASGAVQGGVIADEPTPAIFNTGQVLFGWIEAYRRTGSKRARDSASRAADFLVAQMDSDGAWRKNLSAFTSTPIETYAYNVRSAWALMLADDLDRGADYRAAALRNVGFTLSLAQENGWIANNCLGRPEQPLLHTIAYAYQGLLECAVRGADERALELTVRGNEELRENFDHFGRLHGRYAASWNPTVRWRCLTGEAQTAIVWQRLGAVTGDPRWQDAAARLILQIKRTQPLRGNEDIIGGIRGAWPMTAPYGPLQYLNWAAKFFADALMLELGCAQASRWG